MKLIIILVAILSLTRGILSQEKSPCFEISQRLDSLTDIDHKWDARFLLTHYQGILRCAKTVGENTIEEGTFGPQLKKCFWLDNLDTCIQIWKNGWGIDCEEPFKDLIRSFIIVSDQSYLNNLILRLLFHLKFQEGTEHIPKCFHDYLDGSYNPKINSE